MCGDGVAQSQEFNSDEKPGLFGPRVPPGNAEPRAQHLPHLQHPRARESSSQGCGEQQTKPREVNELVQSWEVTKPTANRSQDPCSLSPTPDSGPRAFACNGLMVKAQGGAGTQKD